MVDSIAGFVSVVKSKEEYFIEIGSLQLHDDSFCILETAKRNPSSIKTNVSCLPFYENLQHICM